MEVLQFYNLHLQLINVAFRQSQNQRDIWFLYQITSICKVLNGADSDFTIFPSYQIITNTLVVSIEFKLLFRETLIKYHLVSLK